MILVTGATGQLGSATIEFLLQKLPASQIAALVRDEQKAADLANKGIDIRTGDYDNPVSLEKAFTGIKKLFFISGNDVVARLQQHENVVNAAKIAGVPHIIYTSFARKNETDTNPLGLIASSHIETDKLVKESGIPYTIMLNGLYADVLPFFFGDHVFDNGIQLPAGNGAAAYILRNDIAEAAANILTTDGHQGKTYHISNTEKYTMQQVANILSELSGNEVTYISPSTQEYINGLTIAGIPAQTVSMLAGFSEAIRQEEFDTADSDIVTLLGRKPARLKDFFKQTYFSNN